MSALIILASGLSERFGAEDKLLADLNGKPVASYSIAAATPIAFTERFAVIAKDNVKLEGIFHEAGFSIIWNENPQAGHKASRNLGVKAVKTSGHKQACIMLADMPAIPTSHLNVLMAIDGKVVMSRCGGIPMPPVFMRDLNAPIVPDAHIDLTALQARDIDTQEDLAAMSLAMSQDRI